MIKTAYELGVAMALQDAGMVKEARGRFWEYISRITGGKGSVEAAGQLQAHPQLNKYVNKALRTHKGNPITLQGAAESAKANKLVGKPSWGSRTHPASAGDTMAFLRRGTSPRFNTYPSDSFNPFRQAAEDLGAYPYGRSGTLSNLRETLQRRRVLSGFAG